MSDDQSARLALPYLVAGQMQKHVTLNETLTRLDALVQTAVVSRSIAVQPSAPTDGDLYILPEGAVGEAWNIFSAGDLVRAEAGGWTAVPTAEGCLTFVADAGEFLLKRAEGWMSLATTLREIGPIERLGVGAEADAENPFTARLNKALWTAREAAGGGDGDLRLTLNKEAAGDVLSLLFQSGYGGRAELGLVGNDDLTLKVSPDGGTWRTAFRVDRASAQVFFETGACRRETTVMTANGDWTPPAWAKSVEAIAVGGGGAGGPGASGSLGDRYGGGGGGAGGIAFATWPAGQVAGLTVTIGAGGGAGVDGGDTILALGPTAILTAHGGQAGGAGAGTSGSGGKGGPGSPRSNGGGNSHASAVAGAGESLARPDAPGGGGAGGALNAGGVAFPGGAGGEGGAGAVKTTGGIGGVEGGGWGGWSAPKPDLHWSGGGGGGGGASTSGTGHAGGDGGGVGAGGGGGGAGLTAGGIGGAGADGVVWLTAIG